MKARPENIERLLNGYIDGELTVRQQTEVKRLLGNDPMVARRLRQLEKCKMLVSSLPAAQVPAEMTEDIMARLARRSLLGEEPAAVDENAGAKDLFMRKIFAAAAMVALMAVFGAVVYTIVAPPASVPPTDTLAGLGPNKTTEVVETPQTVLAKFNGRLELKTAEFKGMDASINRAVAENGIVECTGVERLGDRTTYVLTCGRKGLNRLLGRMDKDWARLDSATLFVETDAFDQPVVVSAVTTDQITEITTQTTPENTVRVAKDLALVNNVAAQLRSRAVLVASNKAADLIGIDRPRLTSRTVTIEKATIDKPNVELVIVLTKSK